MRPNSVLITGSNGFVGRHLVARLALDFPGATLHAAKFDIADPGAVLDTVRSLRPNVCVHLAGVTSVSQAREAPDRAWAVNVGGTLSLARAILTHAPDCLLLYVSSSEVYGASFAAGLPVDETAPLAPLNTYGATKAAADLAMGAMAHDGLRVVRLRPFNHVGAGQSDAFVVSAFARQITRIGAGKQNPVLRVGMLDVRRDFMNVRDVVSAYSLCISFAEKLEPGSIINLASGQTYRVGDVLEMLLQLSGIEALVEVEAALLRSVDIPVACGNANYAREVLHWTPSMKLVETLREVLRDWRTTRRDI